MVSSDLESVSVAFESLADAFARLNNDLASCPSCPVVLEGCLVLVRVNEYVDIARKRALADFDKSAEILASLR